MTKQQMQVALERSQRKVAYLEGKLREIAAVKFDHTGNGMAAALGACQAKAQIALENGDWYALRSTPRTKA